MASGVSQPSTSIMTPQAINKKAARKAITKRAKRLREMMENTTNIELFVKVELLPRDGVDDVIQELQSRVSQNPELFRSLIATINMLDTSEAKQLQDICPCEIPYTLFKKGSALDQLQSKLNTLRELNPSEAVIKGAISEVICRRSTVDDIDTIKDGLSKMQREGYFSSAVLGWAIVELKKRRKVLEEENEAFRLQACKPLELDSELLYHASLCSMAVNNYDTQGCVKLIQSLSIKSLKKLSISQCQDDKEFPKCLIAKNTDKTYFVAFESHLNFKFWTKTCEDVPNCTFGKGLERVITDLPTLFFENIIKKGHILIITGFSFGGVLAHMLTAQLWQLPQIYSDELRSNLICITFGQPFIQSSLLTRVAELFPGFTENVHALRLEKDSIPFVLGKLDGVVCSEEVLFPSIVENLSYLQEASISMSDSHLMDPQCSSTFVPSKMQLQAERELKIELQKPLPPELDPDQPNPNTIHTATNYLIVPTDKPAGVLKFVCVDDKLLARINAKISQNLSIQQFEHHCAGVYHQSVKIFTLKRFESKHIQQGPPVVVGEFLCPIIEGVKVTQYGNEATVVVTGKRLWFTHSLTLSTVLKNPFQVQKETVSFSSRINDIMIVTNNEGKEVTVTLKSYFAHPISKKICVELDPNRLSPRGSQLAQLEPTHLIELAFMMALLEKRQKRLNQSTSDQGEFSPLFGFIQHFLHLIASVVPYESILCTIAHCKDEDTVSRCISLIKQLNVEFPFSLTMYASVIVALARMQGANFELPEIVKNPLEDYAYYSWLATKLMDSRMRSLFQDDQSEDTFTSPPGSLSQLSSSFLLANPLFETRSKNKYLTYLQVMAKGSLQQKDVAQASALSNKSAMDLYKFKNEGRSLKSPIQALIEGREKLEKLSSGKREVMSSAANKEMVTVLNNARGEQFDLCIGVICGFMYQHVRVPFTEENPVTLWKSLQVAFGTAWDMIFSGSDPSKAIISMTKRCQKVISKGTDVAEHMYDGKLKFILKHMDPAASACTPPSKSKYLIYILEQKLKDLCSERGITVETRLDDIVNMWRSYFSNDSSHDHNRRRRSPSTYHLLDVARSHRSLIARWIKWSLMVNDLRSKLEQYTTVAVAGLVNSGKTQLMRNLFGLDVKAGTRDDLRTTVPFIYSLSPDVNSVNIIDFPGADDSDDPVVEMVEFLKFIAQIVIFIVSYEKAHTKPAQKWLEKFEVISKGEGKSKHGSRKLVSDTMFEDTDADEKEYEKVPVLVCMTHADKLLGEIIEEKGEDYNPGQGKKDIARHFEKITKDTYGQGIWNPKNRRTIGYYCFDLSRSRFSVTDISDAGIRGPSHVGEWLCNQVRNEIHMTDAANQLEEYLKHSCNTTLKKPKQAV